MIVPALITLWNLKAGQQPSIQRIAIEPRGAAALPERTLVIEHRPDARRELAREDRQRVIRVSERACKTEFGGIQRS